MEVLLPWPCPASAGPSSFAALGRSVSVLEGIFQGSAGCEGGWFLLLRRAVCLFTAADSSVRANREGDRACEFGG